MISFRSVFFLKILGCNVCASRFQWGIWLLWCIWWDHWHRLADGIAPVSVQPDPVALLKEHLVPALLMPLLFSFLQLTPPADLNWFWWKCLLCLHSCLCVCRMKYYFEFTILCLCTLHTLNNKGLDSQLEHCDVTLIPIGIHSIALCSLSSSISREIWKSKITRLYSRCCLVCAWNRWGG